MPVLSRRALLATATAAALLAALPGTGFAAEAPGGGTIAGINALGIATLVEQATAAPAANHAVSPLSLGGAVALLAQAAKGETASRFARTLGAADPAAIADAWRDAAEALTGARTPAGPLALAAGLWHAPAMAPDGAAKERLTGSLGATVAPLPKEGAEAINAWAKEASGGMIASVLDRLDPETELVVASALAFKASWATAFDPAQTRREPFTLADGTTVQVDMMARDDRAFAHRHTDRYRAVRVPYTDPSFALVLALPLGDGTPAGLFAPRADGAAPDWLAADAYTPHAGRLSLPRLSLNARTDLMDEAANKTVAGLLGGPLDLGGLGAAWEARPQQVGQAVQAVALRWDETGTEAAAVTAIAIARSLDADGPFALTLDRPFAFALTHMPTGAILLAGVVARPSPASDQIEGGRIEGDAQ